MRRSRFEIIGKILSLATDGTKKTPIVYRANLNFNVVNRYLNLLIKEGPSLVSEARDIPNPHFERWVNGCFYRVCDFENYDRGGSQAVIREAMKHDR